MTAIWIAMCPGATNTRIVGMRGPSETILKAYLRRDPSSPQALQRLLEAIAMWEGSKVRAALAVDDNPQSPGYRVFDHALGIEEATPLYDLQCVPYTCARDHRDLVRGMGRFRDLQQILRFEIAR